MKIEKRNIATCVILSIVTCGIYGIIWVINFVREAVRVKDENDDGVLEIVLSLLLGPVGLYLTEKKLAEGCQMRGIAHKDNSIIYIVLCIFGLGIVAYAMVQNDLNSIADIINDQAGVNQPPYGAQPPYGTQAPYGNQAPYGAQPPYGNDPQAPYGAQPPYGNDPQAPYGAQPPYGNDPQAPYGAQPHYGNDPQAPYGAQPPYGNDPQAPYGAQPPYGNDPQAPYGNQPPYGNDQQPPYGN